MRRAQWRLEDYSVAFRISKGAYSAVYKATCLHSGQAVALKIYFLSRTPEALRFSLSREIKIHSNACHPNIIAFYAAFQTEAHLVMVLEFATHGDLLGVQQAQGRLFDDRQLSCVILAPLVEALKYLHRKGIIHRDIKPENVLITANWQLKLANFGVSIDLTHERAVTRAGTESYMAPEVARCPLKYHQQDNKENLEVAYTPACDIWAVGVLAYELINGVTPIAPLDGSDACAPALHFPTSTPEVARNFIALTMAQRPEERPTSLQLAQHPWLRGQATRSEIPAQQAP